VYNKGSDSLPSVAEGDHPPRMSLPPCHDLAVATPTIPRRARIILPGQLVERDVEHPGKCPQRVLRGLGNGTVLYVADDGGRDSRGLAERLLGEAPGEAQGAEAPADSGSGRCLSWYRTFRVAVLGARCR